MGKARWRRQEAARAKEVARREARARRRRIRWILIALIAGIGVGGGGYWLASRSAAAKPGRFVPSLGNEHLSSPSAPHIPYNSNPPTSGPHLPYIAPWGIHDVPIPKELQVHNLEDGGVAIQYHCDTPCPELVERLKGISQRYAGKPLLVAPYPDMEHRIALTAWTRLDTFDEFDEARIEAFIQAYMGIDHHGR